MDSVDWIVRYKKITNITDPDYDQWVKFVVSKAPVPGRETRIRVAQMVTGDQTDRIRTYHELNKNVQETIHSMTHNHNGYTMELPPGVGN